MTNPVGTITVKLVLDTSELDAKLAELNKDAARTAAPRPVAFSERIDQMADRFRGASLATDEAEYLINVIRSRARG